MLQYLLLLVVAFFAYQWKGWPAALGVVVAYIVIVALYRMSRAKADKQAAIQVLRTPLSDAEKIHVSEIKERNQRLEERRSKFPS